jgi:hypothetical protein
MKRFLLSFSLLASISQAVLAGNWFGPGPWSSDGPYPGYLNGKYQASVTGVNIIGVVGFSIVDGAPPSRETEVQAANAGGPVTRNVALGVDPFQNYFMIFVEGRTYRGETVAMVNIDTKQVAGSLQGTQPAGIQPIANLNFDATDSLPIVNRGLDGGFTANITSDKALFTFQGSGQLSTPANRQAFEIESLINPPPAAIGDPATNVVLTGRVVTETTPFNLVGIKTSNFATNAVSGAAGAAQ